MRQLKQFLAIVLWYEIAVLGVAGEADGFADLLRILRCLDSLSSKKRVMFWSLEVGCVSMSGI